MSSKALVSQQSRSPSPKSASKSSKKAEIMNTGVKIDGRTLYFTKGLKNPLSGFFFKTADGKKNKVLMKNITNEKTKSVLKNVLKKHSDVVATPVGKVLNPLTGRFVKAGAEKKAMTFDDPISLQKTKFPNGIELNKQWYSKKSLQTMIETGNSRVPHSRRNLTMNEKKTILGKSKYVNKPVSPSIILNMLKEFFKKYDQKVLVKKQMNKFQIEAVFAYKNNYVNRNETAHEEDFYEQIGTNIVKYPVYVSIEPEKKNIRVNFYLNHNDANAPFALDFKLRDDKTVEYVFSFSKRDEGALQNAVSSFVKSAFELNKIFEFTKNTRYIWVFASDKSNEGTIKSEINSLFYKPGDKLIVGKLYDIIENDLSSEDWVSWNKKINSKGEITDVFGPPQNLANPHGRLRDARVEIEIQKIDNEMIVVIINDEFSNKFYIGFSLKNDIVKRARIGSIIWEDDDMKNDYYITDFKEWFTDIARSVAPPNTITVEQNNNSNNSNNNMTPKRSPIPKRN